MVDESWNFRIGGMNSDGSFSVCLAKAMCNDTVLDAKRGREMKKTVFAYKKVAVY